MQYLSSILAGSIILFIVYRLLLVGNYIANAIFKDITFTDNKFLSKSEVIGLCTWIFGLILVSLVMTLLKHILL